MIGVLEDGFPVYGNLGLAGRSSLTRIWKSAVGMLMIGMIALAGIVVRNCSHIQCSDTG